MKNPDQQQSRCSYNQDQNSFDTISSRIQRKIYPKVDQFMQTFKNELKDLLVNLIQKTLYNFYPNIRQQRQYMRTAPHLMIEQSYEQQNQDQQNSYTSESYKLESLKSQFEDQENVQVQEQILQQKGQNTTLKNDNKIYQKTNNNLQQLTKNVNKISSIYESQINSKVNSNERIKQFVRQIKRIEQKLTRCQNQLQILQLIKAQQLFRKALQRKTKLQQKYEIINYQLHQQLKKITQEQNNQAIQQIQKRQYQLPKQIDVDQQQSN